MSNIMLDPEERKSVQSDFQEWLEIQDRRKELTNENKEIIENSARILNVKGAIVTKLFKVLQKKMEDGSDELEDLYNLVSQVGA